MVYEAPRIHEVGRAENVVQGFLPDRTDIDGTPSHMPGGDLND